jgi:hypothetical protein
MDSRGRQVSVRFWGLQGQPMLLNILVNIAQGWNFAADAVRPPKRASTADFELAARRPRLDFDRPEMASAS